MARKRAKRARRNALEEQVQLSYVGRRNFVLVLFVLAGAALVWRAVDQQILEKDFLQSEGADRYLDTVLLSAHRGLITDRRGAVLALSTPVDSISANPRVLRPDLPGLDALAGALDMAEDDLRQRLLRFSGRHFVYLQRRMPPDAAAHVLQVAKAHGLRGVHREREYRRYYPAGEVFSHVVGFTDIDDRGQEGVELAYDGALSGRDGAKRVLRDGRRQAVDDVESIRAPMDGSNLALGMDERLQYIAYRELKAAVRRNRALAGSAVVLDARSGEILAMVNQPAYNPNGNRANTRGRLRNRAMTDVFEPGSTMKPLTVAVALEEGGITPRTVVDTAPGFFKVGAARVRDHHDLGRIDVATILRKSSNVGAARIALELEPATLWESFDALGFGRAPGTGFPGEAAGRFASWRNWARIDHATLAFGYGLSVSTLQLAHAYAALANDGVAVPLSLLKVDRLPAGERVFSARVARQVLQMLESVVSVDGTAPQAAIEGYRVAGKTGTAKKSEAGGYSDDRYQAVFAGVAPLSDPRLVMVVMIDEPRAGKYYGGQVAGPVFSRVMGEALRLLNIAPDALTAVPVQVAQVRGDGGAR